MPAFLPLLMSNPAAIGQAGGALQPAAQGFTDTGQAFRKGMDTALANWQGRTRNRANGVSRRFATGVGKMAGVIRAAGVAAEEGSALLQPVVVSLRSGVQTAQGMGFVVLPFGQVFPGPPHYAQAAAAGPAGPAVLAEYLTIARGWTAYFQVLVNTATAEDEALARVIGGLVAKLDELLPFRSSVRAPRWFVRGGGRANNVRRGELGNQLNAIWLDGIGLRELGTEVRIRRATGDPYHMRADRISDDTQPGILNLFEVKGGASRVSPNQQDILPRLRYGGPQFADDVPPVLTRGHVAQPGQVVPWVQHWDVDALPDSVRDVVYHNGYDLHDIINGRAGPQTRDDLVAWMNNPAVRHDRVL